MLASDRVLEVIDQPTLSNDAFLELELLAAIGAAAGIFVLWRRSRHRASAR